MIKKIIFLFFLLISNIAFSSNEKIALIIGNSKYQNLGSLNNTINDAKLIEKSLKEIGYKTQIVLDANEQQARKAIKNFAIESESSNIALVFYAGHGAQVLGENYLLPTDIDIPKRESDIQLSGIKVDDIVNTIHSKVKVVFLDACRDNPALIKSLSKGRGSYQGGLAPAKSTSFTDNSSGIFIAYATDSGNVALDGNDKDSPFSLALAKYIKEPISVDDMFSKVTKEVRQKTNNAQKPYKYASLEGVVCLTSSCQSSDFSLNTNQISKTDKVFITDDQSRLAMLSDTGSKKTTSNSSQNFDLPSNWVFFTWSVDKDRPDVLWHIQPSSIKRDKDLVTFDTKNIPASSKSSTKESAIFSWVANCSTYKIGIYETKMIDQAGKVLKDNKVNDPEFITLDNDFSTPGTVGNWSIYHACNKEKLIPMIETGELNSEKWHKLFTNDIGSDTFYLESSLLLENGKLKIFVKEDYAKEKKLSERGTTFAALKESVQPSFQQLVMTMEFECGGKEYTIPKEQYYDSKEQLIAYNYYINPVKFEIKSTDPALFIMKKFCKS